MQYLILSLQDISLSRPKSHDLEGAKSSSFVLAEAVSQRCSVKLVLLEISQNSQENTCARVSFLIKLQA